MPTKFDFTDINKVFLRFIAMLHPYFISPEHLLVGPKKGASTSCVHVFLGAECNGY